MVPRKVVLITGCSAGGLGHALAEAFAREGCSVWASARRLGSMQALVPLGCRLLELDVTDEQQLQAAVQTMVDEEGHIDVSSCERVGTAVRAMLCAAMRHADYVLFCRCW